MQSQHLNVMLAMATIKKGSLQDVRIFPSWSIFIGMFWA